MEYTDEQRAAFIAKYGKPGYFLKEILNLEKGYAVWQRRDGFSTGNGSECIAEARETRRRLEGKLD